MKRTYTVAAIAASAFFMQQLDGTIVATALPQIAASFGENAVDLHVVITAYVLSMAVFLPVSGWMADRFGGRTVFQAAIGLFTLGSLLCGISDNAIELVLARIIQGAGGAFMVPVGRLVVLRTAHKSEFIQALAFMQIPSQIGAAAGPLLGGLIATYASWRWIFLINVPIGVIGIVCAGLFIEDFREARKKALDWVGFLLVGTLLATLLYGLESFARYGVGDMRAAAAILCSAIALLLAVRHSRRHAQPLIDLTLLRRPTFRANLTGGTLFRLGTDGLPFLLPLLFQAVFHFTPFVSGILTFASAAGSLAMRATAAKVFRRFGFRAVLLNNALISAASVFCYGFLDGDTPMLVMLLVVFVGGTFQALEFVALNAISYADIEPGEMSAATTFAQLGQKSMGGFGVTFGSLLLQIALTWRGEDTLTAGDFLFAFAASGALCAISALFYLALDHGAGREVSGHTK